MRKADLIFTGVLVPIDYIALVAAACTAFVIRYAGPVQDVRPVIFNLPFHEFLSATLLIAAAWILLFAFSGLYAIHAERKIADDAVKILLGCSTGTLLVIVIFFFSRELFSSRFIVLAGWVFATLYVFIGRMIMRAVRRTFWRRGKSLHAVGVIGIGITADTLCSAFTRREHGHTVALRAPHWNTAAQSQFKEYVEHGGELDELVLTDTESSREQINLLRDFCTAHQIVFKYSAELTGTGTADVAMDMVNGVPLVELKSTRLDGWGRILKRLFDIATSAFGMACLAPITLLVGALIKIEDGGPVFVGLPRVGLRGKIFTLYKFRSMCVGAHNLKAQLMGQNERADGPLFKMKHDPRVTRTGKWLRASSIDELPQLWNVIRGDMSLVGPRPHEPEEVQQYQAKERHLLFIRPGITGMAQVSGRTNLSFSDEARIDTFYVQHWSFLLDLVILMKTPFVVLKKTGI